MDDDSDAAEAFERQLFQIDGDRDSSDSDIPREVEEILYSNSHYASDLGCEQSPVIDKPDSTPHDKHEVEPDEESSGVEKTRKTRRSNTKRYYDKVDEHIDNKVCNKCNEKGHIQRDCKKWMKDIVCYNCNETGHMAKDCKSNKGDRVCYKCNETGHIARECKSNKNDMVVCYNCNETGHISRECKINKKVCYNCNETGHISNDCQTFACNRCGVAAGHTAKDCKHAQGKKGACFICGDIGHIARNCPSSNTTNKRTISKLLCHCCGKAGHYARDCLDANDQIERRDTLNKSNDHGDLPIYNTKWNSIKPLGTFNSNTSEKELDILPKHAFVTEEHKKKRDDIHVLKSLHSTDDKLKLKEVEGKENILLTLEANEIDSISSENKEIEGEKVMSNAEGRQEVGDLKSGSHGTSDEVHSINSKETSTECANSKKMDLVTKSVSPSVSSLVKSPFPIQVTKSVSPSVSSLVKSPFPITDKRSVSPSLTSLVKSPLSINGSKRDNVIVKSSLPATNSKTIVIDVTSSDDNDEITVPNDNAKVQEKRSSQDLDISDVVNLISDGEGSTDNQVTKCSVGTNYEKKGREYSTNNSQCNTDIQYSPHIDLGLDDDVAMEEVKESKNAKRKRRKRKKNAEQVQDASVNVNSIVQDVKDARVNVDPIVEKDVKDTSAKVNPVVKKDVKDASVKVNSAAEKVVKDASVKVNSVVEKVVKDASVKVNPVVKKDVKDASVKVNSAAEKVVKDASVKVNSVVKKDVKDASVKVNSVVKKDVKDASVKVNSVVEDNVKGLKTILDHETLNNLRDILWDSGDEEYCDTGAIPDHLFLPSINLESSNATDDRILTDPSPSDDGPCYGDRINNNLDATHYNPTQLRNEDLNAYGVHNSPMRESEIENRKWGSRKRKHKTKDPATNIKKQKVTSQPEKSSILRTLKKNFSCNNHNSTTPEHTTSKTKTKTEERGFLFRKVAKKDVIVLD